MFTKSMHIIFIKRTGIEGAEVSKRISHTVKNRIKAPWDENSFQHVVVEMIKKLGAKHIRVLLGDDLSYVFETDMPKNTETSDERSVVFKIVKETIPETLEPNQWDYTVYKGKTGERRLRVFAPVKDIFQKLSDGLHEAGCIVDAIEPESIAKLRNPDPFVGIAMRKDRESVGLDLFDALKKEPPSDSPEPKTNPTPPPATMQTHKKVRESYLITFLLVLIVGLLTVAGMYYIRAARPTQKISEHILPENLPPSPTQIVQEETLNTKAVKLLILNGSGTAGQATEVAKLFEAAGFETIDTGNADAYTYQQTEVRFKEGSPSATLRSTVEEVLTDYNVSVKDSLQSDYEYDVLIIVGKKK